MTDRVAELEHQLRTTSDTRQKVDLLNAMARELRHSALSQAIAFSEQARRLSSSGEFAAQPYALGLATSLLYLGQMRAEQGDCAEALDLLLQALPLCEALDPQTGRMKVLHGLGNAYAYLSDYSNALRYYLEVLSIAQANGDREQEAGALHNIGWTYTQVQDYQQALTYFQQCLPIFETIGSKLGLAYTCDSTANAYYHLGDYTQALAYSLRSVPLAREAGTRLNETNALTTLGDIYLAQGAAEQASTCFQQALQVARSIGARYGMVEALRRLGDTYRRQARESEALDLLQQALTLANAINAPSLGYECHLALAEIYRDLRQFEQALAHYEQFHNLKEMVISGKTTMQLQALTTAHQVETAHKEAEISRLQNVKLQQEIEQRQQIQVMLEELALTDALTGLYNRRYVLALAQHELERARRYERPLAVIMLDLDHFKQVNDTYGHAAGDQVLVAAARYVREHLRQADIPARYGGEEFIILLPETDLAQATEVAERMCRSVAMQPVSIEGESIEITASLGVTATDGQADMTLPALIERADQALYRAKQTGRNRVALYQP